MVHMRPVITLTTDFGNRDGYVGTMKGVILAICPDAHLVDITHEIAPQDVAGAALVVRSFVPYFPADAVHLVVVDPGVGSTRQPVACATPVGRFVGPNNGIFGHIWQQAREQHGAEQVRAVVLNNSRYWLQEISATFHGRDIFAPSAAHLAAGTTVDEMGTPIETLQTLPEQPPAFEDNRRIVGQIMYIDHFGNCISNIEARHLQQLGPLPELQVQVGKLQYAIAYTYASVLSGEALALLGSEGYLEIAVRDGSANQQLHIERGTVVRVERQAAS